MLDAYPSKLLNTTLQMVFAATQSFFIALAVERDFSRWKLKLDISLIAVLYSVSEISLAYCVGLCAVCVWQQSVVT
jgi:hypothetical protein